MRRPSFEKAKQSQRVSRAAVPSKRSSPPAVKCRVCIGPTRSSQGEKGRKIEGFRPFAGVPPHVVTKVGNAKKTPKQKGRQPGGPFDCRLKLRPTPPPAAQGPPRLPPWPRLWLRPSRVPRG